MRNNKYGKSAKREILDSINEALQEAGVLENEQLEEILAIETVTHEQEAKFLTDEFLDDARCDFNADSDIYCDAATKYFSEFTTDENAIYFDKFMEAAPGAAFMSMRTCYSDFAAFGVTYRDVYQRVSNLFHKYWGVTPPRSILYWMLPNLVMVMRHLDAFGNLDGFTKLLGEEVDKTLWKTETDKQ